jgi:hypothetical protein
VEGKKERRRKGNMAMQDHGVLDAEQLLSNTAMGQAL